MEGAMAVAKVVANTTPIVVDGVTAGAEAVTTAAKVAEVLPSLPEIPLEPPPAALDAAAQLEADFTHAPSADPTSLIEGFAEGSTTQEAPTLEEFDEANQLQTQFEVKNATPLPEQKPTTPEERMNAYIENNMQKWEADNPMPDRDTKVNEFEEWQTKKVDHMKRMEGEAQFHEDIRTWEEANPDPGADKNPDAHRQWLKDREAHKKELKAAQEKSDPDAEKKDEQTDEDAEKEAEKALENPENQSKLAKLKELYQKRAVLLGEKVSLEQIVAAAQKAKTDYAGVLTQLTENSGKLSNVEREIQQLESELKITKPKVGLIIKAVLALFGAGALLAVSGAKQA